MSSPTYKFIDISDPSYQDAVSLRIKAFFSEMENSKLLINDGFESDSFHLICLQQSKVIGTGRLFVENKIGLISQMAIDPDYREQGIGSKILRQLMLKCQEMDIQKIKLSARLTALDFYKKFDFVAVGEPYPSKKTTILHQDMEFIARY